MEIATDLPVHSRRRIDAICDRFETEWREGKPPNLADFLAETAGPTRLHLFRELVALDQEFRRQNGEHVTTADYCTRFPELATVLDATSSGERLTVTIPHQSRTECGDVSQALRDAGYEVLGELGRGGMGIVFRARDTVGREVAVKVIRSAEFASEKELRRFRDEAEAVALLDHPHIVPIHEVGESRGLPYFSMKLVPGASLDRRLASYQNDPRASARLMVVAAEAIHHAHQRGILHRDLKPANILIDERNAPHVTDFGLARRIDPGSIGNDSKTFAGTPAYMSPEQTSGRSEALTTAVDVYGLGAILYALLTGRAPHSGDSLTETLDRVRAIRPQTPSQLNPRVPRDLDVICLKALEKEAKHRYASAQDLADDLNRWLSGHPIAARPVGSMTRCALWCRRHPLPAALSALLAISLVAGFAGVTWKWREASRNAARSAALVDYLAHRILAEGSTQVNPFGSNLTVRQMLDRAAARIAGDFQGQPDIEAAIRETVAGAYDSLGEFARAEPQWQAALRLDNELYGPRASATLHASNRLAATRADMGRVDVESTFVSNLKLCERFLDREAPVTLEARELLGGFYQSQHRFLEAEPLLHNVLDARRRVLPQDHPDTLRLLRMLSLLLVERRRLDEAQALALEYEHGIRCTCGPNHPDNVDALANLGLIRRIRGQRAEAEPYYRRAAQEAHRILGPQHPRTIAVEADLAGLLRELNPPIPSS